MKDFNFPGPKEFQAVKALQHFTGTEKNGHDLRLFGEWYTQHAIEWLMHCEPRNTNSPLRVVFTTDSNVDAFYLQLGNFHVLRNDLNKAGIFISKEPGAGQNHFIFGIFYADKLLIINPIGETRHQDFYRALKKAHTELALEIYLCETPIQHDPQPSLVSCGPICVELADHFFEQNLEKLFETLSQQGVEKNNQGLCYKAVDLTAHLPPSLKQLITEQNPDAYQKNLWNIRISHYCHLLEICHLLQNVKEINTYFAEECTNSSEQQLLNMLLLNELNMLSFDKDPQYIALRRGEPVGLAAKLKNIRAEKLEQAKAAKKSPPQAPQNVSKNNPLAKKDDISHLKILRNIMLLSLMLIPFAHFFIWPYFAPMLGLAAAQFLTASSTPWVFAALSTVLFSALIIGTLAYEEYYGKSEHRESSASTSESGDDFVHLGTSSPTLQFSAGANNSAARLEERVGTGISPTADKRYKP